MRPVVAGTLVASLFVTLGVGWLVWNDTPGTAARPAVAGSGQPLDSSALAPTGERVRVLVLNGSDRDGLARRAMQQLRDHGYDVVDFGDSPEKPAPTTVEVERSRLALAERLVRALGAGSVQPLEQPLPHLDVRVTVGADWQPSPQSFRP